MKHITNNHISYIEVTYTHLRVYLTKKNMLTEYMHYIPDDQNGLFLHLDCLLYNSNSHKPIGDK